MVSTFWISRRLFREPWFQQAPSRFRNPGYSSGSSSGSQFLGLARAFRHQDFQKIRRRLWGSHLPNWPFSLIFYSMISGSIRQPDGKPVKDKKSGLTPGRTVIDICLEASAAHPIPALDALHHTLAAVRAGTAGS